MASPVSGSPDHSALDRSATIVSLRHAGARKAKARAIDPAAVPVGTDAEASGASSLAEQAASEVQAEMMRDIYNHDPSENERNPAATVVILGAILAAAVVTVAAVLWTQP